MTRAVEDRNLPLGQASNNFQFAVAVATFGMCLRKSDFLDGTSKKQILAWATGSTGADPHGYLAEIITLVGQS